MGVDYKPQKAITKKMLETEEFVDEYIENKGFLTKSLDFEIEVPFHGDGAKKMRGFYSLKEVLNDFRKCVIKELQTNNYEVRPAITKNMREAEIYVDEFTNNHGYPPSYKQVADYLGVTKTSAYNRLRHCRDKMSSDLGRKKGK